MSLLVARELPQGRLPDAHLLVLQAAAAAVGAAVIITGTNASGALKRKGPSFSLRVPHTREGKERGSKRETERERVIERERLRGRERERE